MSCHQEIPQGNLAVSAMTHIAEMVDVTIDKKEHATIVHKILNLSAWVQLLGVSGLVLLLLYIVYTVFIKKRPINPRNRGWK